METKKMTEEAKTIEDEFNDLDNDDMDAVPEQIVNKEFEDEELGVEDFQEVNYLKTPEVGESIEFTVDKIISIKDPAKHYAINGTTGEQFCTGVKKKDGTVLKLDIITTDNERFTLSSWGLFYLFRSAKSEFAKEVIKRGTMKGISVRLKRLHDGSVPNKKVKDVMKLYDFATEEEAATYQKLVAKATKEGKLFSLEFLN